MVYRKSRGFLGLGLQEPGFVVPRKLQGAEFGVTVWLDFMASGRLLEQHHCDRLHSRWAVHTEMPNFSARILNGTLCFTRCRLRSRVSPVVSFLRGGLPKIFPFARACSIPALTRSAISARSNCATAPIIWKTNSPAGKDVSTASVTETKSIPSALHISSPDMSCFKERANLSNFQTTTTSTDPRRQAFISSLRAGRLELAPETPWSR